MKFINYLEDISGVGIYPMISLLVFSCFFVLMAIWVFSADKKYIEHMKNTPFDQERNA